MFRRKSKQKKSVDENSDATEVHSMETVSDSEENEIPAENISDSMRKKSKSVEEPFIASDIIKELFTIPVSPEVSVTTELTDPASVFSHCVPTVIKVAEWTAIFLLGYLGFSYAWIICFALAFHTYITTKGSAGSKTEMSAKCTRVHEKEIFKDSFGLESLPSWVTFPDVEKVEWINVIMKKIWPNIGQISKLVAKRLVEPKINEILKRLALKGVNLETVSNFKLKDLILGSVPARIGGIKVYDRNTGRDEIVMDIEIIYGGDARVKFSVQKMDCEINQVNFRATARLVIKPLMDVLPLIGGLEFYFISMPSMDYNLGGMANVGEIPGISNMIRSVLDSIIRKGFVWPNRFNFFLPLESVAHLHKQGFALPSPQGVLTILIREGRDLVKKDKHLMGGKSDPYVVLNIGETKISFVDQYVDSDVNPVWNYVAEFPIEEPSGLALNLEVFDFDSGSDDDFMGRSSINIESFVETGSYEHWLTLEDTKHGSVLVKGVWSPISPSGVSMSSTRCVASVYIDSCSNLSNGKSSPPFPKCEIRVGSQQKKPFSTKPRGPTENPVFQEGHYFLSQTPTNDTINIQVVDHKSGSMLGKVSIKLTYLMQLPDNHFSNMEWRLEGGVVGQTDATVTLSAKLHSY
eukprot:TRINITY_DN10844_c0_g1_i1.p1 TRINITY_DN10844_c0_g1~~TRINITY_DN10844_c0_g1_i1.p1  ORF type:complete len:634 (-),score=188.89 TRINITY_DN10844_c0_g1_i1:498-2399(-)